MQILKYSVCPTCNKRKRIYYPITQTPECCGKELDENHFCGQDFWICDFCAIHAGGERHKLAKILRRAQAGTCDICEMRGLVVHPEAWGL